MEDLPNDVLTNILSRLPVTSLLQFRSISKSWRSLIDSDHFKTLHLNNSHKFNSKLILQTRLLTSKLYTANLPIPDNPVSLNQPLNSYGRQINFLGSCNGLLCIKNFKDEIAIWNPSLSKHWTLPYLSISHPFDPIPDISLYRTFFCFVRYGFGFDSFTEDYKLVRIISFKSAAANNFEFEVNLFSCRTNVWKTLIDPLVSPDYTYWSLESVFVDRALHWVVHKMACTQLIVAFDLRFEVFDEMPLPELGNNFRLQVSHLGGCLSMLVSYSKIITSIDFWVMKQYGHKDSWCKLFTLMKSSELRDLDSVKPLGYYSQDMKKVLFKDMKALFEKDPYEPKMFWYNLKTKQVSHVTNQETSLYSPAIISVESLVQPPFPSENYRKQQKRKHPQELECIRS